MLFFKIRLANETCAFILLLLLPVHLTHGSCLLRTKPPFLHLQDVPHAHDQTLHYSSLLSPTHLINAAFRNPRCLLTCICKMSRMTRPASASADGCRPSPAPAPAAAAALRATCVRIKTQSCSSEQISLHFHPCTRLLGCHCVCGRRAQDKILATFNQTVPRCSSRAMYFIMCTPARTLTLCRGAHCCVCTTT